MQTSAPDDRVRYFFVYPQKNMQVTFRFYSVAKEIAGLATLPLEVSPGTTLTGALDALCALKPALKVIRTSTLFAVGLDYAEPQTLLGEGDEISFIPPVQGG